jgi:hypothetical protein
MLSSFQCVYSACTQSESASAGTTNRVQNLAQNLVVLVPALANRRAMNPSQHIVPTFLSGLSQVLQPTYQGCTNPDPTRRITS